MKPEDISRREPEEVRRRTERGNSMLVCAYEEDRKFEALQLEGAISLHEFKKRLPTIPKDQDILFYCA